MSEFDFVVIGSGPAAIAALDAVGSPRRIAVIDGAAPAAAKNSQLPPKIQAVASTEGRIAGVAEFLPPVSRGKPLFSTASVGGLANYWGQQFLPALPGDLRPKGLFADHADFLTECATIEARFQIEGGQPIANAVVSAAGYDCVTPRLLVGTAKSSGNALSAMKRVFRTIEAAKNITTMTARATSFSRIAGSWRILLDNGNELSARRIVLAAGVIGNARLLFRSYPDLARARFRDHAPWMIFTFGLPSLLAARPAARSVHFNTAALEKTENGHSTVYASVYDMRHADLNLIAASTIGLTSNLLGKWRPSGIVSLLKPVQTWTEATTEQIELHTRDGAVFYSAPTAEIRPDHDEGLNMTIKVLKALGGYILKMSRTVPGYGFHYHALELQAAGGAFTSVLDLLRERTASEVFCVDASTLPSIGCRPHTLTAMAAARRLMSQQL